jgi:hypothetical protein
MPDIEKGDTFLDIYASNIQGEKPKYFLCMNEAEELDDKIVCFVMNTERRMDIHTLGCNSNVGKFIIEPGTLDFIKVHTGILLSIARTYTLEEILSNNKIIQLDKITDHELLRRIKNCIDFDDLLPHETVLIKESFKGKNN